jgi:hypothetical protein
LSRMNLPRSTGEVRCGCDVTFRIAPCRAGPFAHRSARHAPEVTAVHVLDAVVSRAALVEERVVGRHQIDDRAILRRRNSRRDSISVSICLAQIVVEVRGTRASSAACLEIAQLQPLAAEVLDDRVRFGSRSIGGPAARGRPVRSTCRARPCPAVVVGMLLHRKNESRDASSRSFSR